MGQHAQHSPPARPAQPRDTAQPGSSQVDTRTGLRRLFGIALLWVALAALVCVPSAGGGMGAALAGVGFLAFAAGLSLFADALKREVIASLRADAPR